MNIWLINPYDELPGEGPEQRYGCLARMLADKGHEVVWVSSSFRHRTRTRFAGVRSWKLEDGRKIFIIDAPAYRKNLSLARLWSQWNWGRKVEREMFQNVRSGELRKPDLILASSPPLEGARAGIRLAAKFGAVSVVDLMDDWPETWLSALPSSRFRVASVGWRVARRLLCPWFRMAAWNMKHADAVSAQSHAFARRAKELGYEGEVHVCYLGGAPSALDKGEGIKDNDERSTDNRERIADKRKDDVKETHPQSPCPMPHALSLYPSSPIPYPECEAFHILYLGSMGALYDIDTLLQAAVLAKEDGLNWTWTLAGEDPDGQWAAAAKAYGLNARIFFPGYIQGAEKTELLHASDVAVIPMDPASNVAVPYKAGEYLSAALPIINSLPGELEELLANTQAGVNYRFGDASSLYARLKTFAEDPLRRQQASEAARKLFEQAFNREITYPEFAEWVVGLKV